MWHFSPIFERYLGLGSYVLVVGLALLLLAAWAANVLFISLPPRRKALLAALRFASLVVPMLASPAVMQVPMLAPKINGIPASRVSSPCCAKTITIPVNALLL